MPYVTIAETSGVGPSEVKSANSRPYKEMPELVVGVFHQRVFEACCIGPGGPRGVYMVRQSRIRP